MRPGHRNVPAPRATLVIRLVPPHLAVRLAHHDLVAELAIVQRFPDALGGTYLAADGLADPNSVVSAYISAARQLGARCLTDVAVTGLETSGGRVTAVQTSAGRIAAGAVVNAAGPWSAPLAGMAGVNLPVQPLRRQWLTTTGLPGLGPGFPFVIDFAQSLYGQHVRVEFLHKLRDEALYPDMQTLIAQIARDVENAKAYFESLRLTLPSLTTKKH